MERKKIVAALSATGAVFVALTLGAGLASGWGGSSSGSYSGSSGVPSLNLNLTFDDCAKCHIAPSNVARHHNLLATSNKQCLDCHKMEADASGQYTVQVVRDCQVCHTTEVHNQVQHTVVTCSRCHGSDIINIHSGWRYSSGTLSVCYLCHTSTDVKVKATIQKGVSGQTVYCTDCHGTNPHSWGGSWGG